MDDLFVNLQVLSIVLEMVGFRGTVKCFQSSHNALDYMMSRAAQSGEQMVDLLITDSQIPSLNGFELVAKVNEHVLETNKQGRRFKGKRVTLRRPAVFMFSDMCHRDFKAKAKRVGIDYFLQKPVREEQLLKGLVQFGIMTQPPKRKTNRPQNQQPKGQQERKQQPSAAPRLLANPSSMHNSVDLD